MRALLGPRKRDAAHIVHREPAAGARLREDIPHLLLREAVVLDRVLRRVVRVQLAVREEVDDHQHTPARPKPGHEPLGGEAGIVEVLVGWNVRRQ